MICNDLAEKEHYLVTNMQKRISHPATKHVSSLQLARSKVLRDLAACPKNRTGHWEKLFKIRLFISQAVQRDCVP